MNGTKKLWLDLGELGDFLTLITQPQNRWQDHGLGLLRTIMHQRGVETDLLSLRNCSSWASVGKHFRGYDLLLMNVRSYSYRQAAQAAKLFKEINPHGIVVTGGTHAAVSTSEMAGVEAFDKICVGSGENLIADLARAPESFPRIIDGQAAQGMVEWPMIDRTLWPRPASRIASARFPWPLEPACGWGPPPVATMLTSRVCPFRCSFCNEASFIPNMGRRPVDDVIDELNFLDSKFGPLGSVVFHDSLFFQNPRWLEEWLEKYPRKARRRWPYWAAGRSDLVRRKPELFEALIRETNWATISIGFESGSDRVLRILNKECTEEDNAFAIDLINRIGDSLEQENRPAPVIFANIILGTPGETRDDAFKTMRSIKRMKRVIPSFSLLSPYPGSALGYQLIAEGVALIEESKDYRRTAAGRKIKGIDYEFYQELLTGKFDTDIDRGLSIEEARRPFPGRQPLAKRLARQLLNRMGYSV